jgi:hypothetical protein
VSFSIGDIPFEETEALTLLGLHDDSPVGDAFYAYGWCRPAQLMLDDARGQTVLHAPLLLALHTPDEPEPGPLRLEFWVPHDDGDEDGEIAVLVPWLSFANARLPALLGDERDVVLALCNPQHKPVSTPQGLGGRRFHYALGDVRAWLDGDHDGSPSINLTAPNWKTADV